MAPKHQCNDKCTKLLHFHDDRIAIKFFDIEGIKVGIFINKDNTFGYIYEKEGKQYANYTKF